MSNLTLLAPALEEARVRLRVVVTQTTSAILAVADSGKAITNAGATTSITYTLPPAVAGRLYEIRNATDAYTLTVAPNGTDRIKLASPGAPTLLPPRTIVVLECHSSGRWTITTDTRISTVYNVRDYGAIGDGTTDDTAAIQAALDAAGAAGGGKVYLPAGQYRHGPLLYEYVAPLAIVGDGMNVTKLYFAPTSDNLYGLTLGKVGNTSTRYWEIRNINFGCVVYDRPRSAIKLIDAQQCTIDSVLINGFYGPYDNHGLHLYGHEHVWVNNFQFAATIPLRFSPNPNYTAGWLSADHMRFSNGYLISDGSTPPSPNLKSAGILIDGGCHLSNASFEEIGITGTKYGLYWTQTTDAETPYAASTTLSFNQLRTEQGATDGWAFYIDHFNPFTAENNYLLGLDIKNAELSSLKNGIYARRVRGITLENVLARMPSPKTIMDVDHAEIVDWKNVTTVANASDTGVVIGANMYMASAAPHYSTLKWPRSAVWMRRAIAAVYGERPLRQMSAHTWYWAGELADGVGNDSVGTVFIPCSSNNKWVHARIHVTASRFTPPTSPPASTASGATTNSAGYAAGATTITLASAGTGSLVAGDLITFAGQTGHYQIVTGDADVSNGGSIVIFPALRQSIPASPTAITVVAGGTASGATTNAAGYAVGQTNITLASAGTGSLVVGDLIRFAGDPSHYEIITGDADVSNGGSIVIAPPLRRAIPAAATEITIIRGGVIIDGTVVAAPFTNGVSGNGIRRVSGDYIATDNIDGDICVYSTGSTPMAQQMVVRNRLGAPAWVTIEVVGKRSVET
jgi:hypothetical protein